MSLEQWLQNAWLQTSEATVAEIRSLLQVVDRDLADASASGLSIDGRFLHAYDAALQLCMIPLRASGYKVPKGSGHHKRAIESLPLTLGADKEELSYHLDRCSRLRGQSVYERIGAVSFEDARDLMETATELRQEVLKWLRIHHANLLPP